MKHLSESTGEPLEERRPRSGMNTGNSVRSFTSSATWGRQNRTLAYQLPSAVSGSTTEGIIGRRTRFSSFLVACTVNTSSVSHEAPNQRRRSSESSGIDQELPPALLPRIACCSFWTTV